MPSCRGERVEVRRPRRLLSERSSRPFPVRPSPSFRRRRRRPSPEAGWPRRRFCAPRREPSRDSPEPPSLGGEEAPRLSVDPRSSACLAGPRTRRRGRRLCRFDSSAIRVHPFPDGQQKAIWDSGLHGTGRASAAVLRRPLRGGTRFPGCSSSVGDSSLVGEASAQGSAVTCRESRAPSRGSSLLRSTPAIQSVRRSPIPLGAAPSRGLSVAPRGPRPRRMPFFFEGLSPVDGLFPGERPPSEKRRRLTDPCSRVLRPAEPDAGGRTGPVRTTFRVGPDREVGQQIRTGLGKTLSGTHGEMQGARFPAPVSTSSNGFGCGAGPGSQSPLRTSVAWVFTSTVPWAWAIRPSGSMT